MFENLETVADRVRRGDPVRRRGSGDGEDDPADRRSGVAAVADQVVEALVSPHALVEAVGFHQVEQALEGYAVLQQWHRAANRRELRTSSSGPQQVLFDGVQQQQAVARSF